MPLTVPAPTQSLNASLRLSGASGATQADARRKLARPTSQTSVMSLSPLAASRPAIALVAQDHLLGAYHGQEVADTHGQALRDERVVDAIRLPALGHQA